MDIIIDKNLYSLEAITATAYHFSGDYYISVDCLNEKDDKYLLSIRSKSEASEDGSIKEIFINELVDQQVRLDIESRFGHIRDLIVEEAFKPVTKR